MAKKKEHPPEDILSLIKTEYISDTKTSYRSLAEKYNFPLKKISAAGRKEGWVQLRVQTGDKILKKTLNRISTEKADELVGAINVANRILKKINETLDDEKQFNRHIVTENFKAKEKIFKKVDTKAIKEMTAAIKDLTAIVDLTNRKDETERKEISIVFKDIKEELNE